MASIEPTDTIVDDVTEAQPEHDGTDGVYDQPLTYEADAIDKELKGDDDGIVDIPDGESKFEIQVPVVTLMGKTYGIKKAIHENLSIAAVMKSAFNTGSWTGKTLITLTPDQYELIRGVIWNDDPRCQLFVNNKNNNRFFGTGFQWWMEFKFGSSSNLTKRSHFGDLQFLHAMGATKNEQPSDTKSKIILWIKTMYNLWLGNGLNPDTALKNTELQRFFNDRNGYGGTTFKSLFMGTTPAYTNPDIKLRALGSCMHLIEDSYAKGHCARDNQGTGPISNFHCYLGQNSDAHSDADKKGGENIDPNKPDTYKDLYGGPAAVQSATDFLNAVAQKKPWEQAVGVWAEKVFQLSSNATPSNTNV